MARKTKRTKWFKPVRGSYLPSSWQGWLSYIPFIAYLIFTMVVGWQDSSTKGLAILYIVPNWVAATVVMTWIAKRTS
ncbi:MAG TPA: hypothetical protein VFW90_02765 [Candidatus Saccharimonadales bacterium]|nr:hypothetical protein [Candidatus Saccharimonadales bacterium]